MEITRWDNQYQRMERSIWGFWLATTIPYLVCICIVYSLVGTNIGGIMGEPACSHPLRGRVQMAYFPNQWHWRPLQRVWQEQPWLKLSSRPHTRAFEPESKSYSTRLFGNSIATEFLRGEGEMHYRSIHPPNGWAMSLGNRSLLADQMTRIHSWQRMARTGPKSNTRQDQEHLRTQSNRRKEENSFLWWTATNAVKYINTLTRPKAMKMIWKTSV